MIGREQFRRHEYADFISTGDSALDSTLKSIYSRNRVRAYMAATYIRELRDALSEMHRVLSCGGTAVIVLGNSQIAGYDFGTVDHAHQIATDLGMKTLLRLRDTIHSRGLMTKRNTTASVITQETVLVMEKR
jgi:hypothetical protein